MTSPFLDYGTSPKDLWVAIMRFVKLLFVIMLIVLLDGFNRQFSFDAIFDQLPGKLYDFTVKYKEPLVTWFKTTPLGVVPGDIVIPFEKKQGEIHIIESGYFDLKDIPLMEAYLEEQLPALVSGNRSFLGYQTAYEVYFVLVLFVPPGILIALTWNLRRLRRRWAVHKGRSLRMIDDIPIFGNISKKRMISTFKAYFGIAVILIISIMPSISLLSHQQLLRMPIKGCLHVEPLGMPTVLQINEVLLVPGSNTLQSIESLELVIIFGIAVYILTLLLKHKPVIQSV
jgi:hypothetical protein